MKLFHYIRSAIATSTLILALFVSVWGIASTPAMALGIASPHTLSTLTVEGLDQRAKSDVNQLVGAGTSDKLEGTVQQVQGVAQQKIGELKGSTDGLMNQIQGRAKFDVGQVKGGLENAMDVIEDTSEDFMDDVKDVLE